jgi:hypothetical protein
MVAPPLYKRQEHVFSKSFVQLQRLAPLWSKSLQIKRQKPPFYLERLMLVGAGQAASAFLVVQLQRLAPRGHKPLQIKRQKPPFYLERLMLVGAGQAASAFLVTSQ